MIASFQLAQQKRDRKRKSEKILIDPQPAKATLKDQPAAELAELARLKQRIRDVLKAQ